MNFKLSRRKFLQSTSLAALALPLAKLVSGQEGFVSSPLERGGSLAEEIVTGGICEMCSWRCQLIGKKRDGRLIKLEGNPKSIDNGRSLCARGNAGIKLLYDPDRLKYPMKNVGERGRPVWKKISWKEALNECGSRLQAVVDRYGPQGIAMFAHGSTAIYPRQYFSRIVGTPNICEASLNQGRGIRDAAYLATIGRAAGENLDMANAKAIFLLGCHFGENVQVSQIKSYCKGLQNGAKLIVVDPRFSASAAKADIWVKIKPGTDTALLLALINYLIINNKYDKDFIEKYATGFDELQTGIAPWSLDKAAAECDIPAAQIKEVADLLAGRAPQVAIHPGQHGSWYGNDFQRERALACLTALLGAYYVKGGWVPGVIPEIGDVGWEGDEPAEILDLNRKGKEHLIHPFKPSGTPTELIRDAALTGKPYPIKGCVIWGQNPIQTVPGQEKTKAFLAQMEFVMCVDIMPTDATMWADILLPEVSYLERYDLIKTGRQWDLSAKHQQYIAARMPLVEPTFACRDHVYITNEIAKRMGHEDKIPVETAEELVDKSLRAANLSLAQLRRENGIHIGESEDPYGVPDDFKVLLHNPDIEATGFSGIPLYVPIAPPPGGFARLISGRVPVHTTNRTQNNAWLHQAMTENPVWVNDQTAARLQLKDGDRVGFVNSEGVTSSTTTLVKITPGIRQDTVYMAHGFGSASPQLSVGFGSGVDDQSLISLLKVDPETGAQATRNNFVKLIKDDKILDFPV